MKQVDDYLSASLCFSDKKRGEIFLAENLRVYGSRLGHVDGLGVVLGGPGVLLGGLGEVLGCPWGVLGVSWRALGGSWGGLGGSWEGQDRS